jgi:ParB family chromosome partitioning protein
MSEQPITSLGDLTPDPRNARKHSPRNVGTIADALREVGAARSIVIDEDGVILAGNATCEAAGEAGITRVQVVDADGETIVAVRRTGLTAAHKAKLALYDNRAAELADGWDAGILKELSAELDLSQMFSAGELAEAMSQVPDFQPVGEDEQGRLDQKKPVTCPSCGVEFVPKG